MPYTVVDRLTWHVFYRFQFCNIKLVYKNGPCFILEPYLPNINTFFSNITIMVFSENPCKIKTAILSMLMSSSF